MDVTFYWTHNGQPIDFEKEGGHFESIKAVSDHAFVISLLGTDRNLHAFMCPIPQIMTKMGDKWFQ